MSSILQKAPVNTSGAATSVSPPLYAQFFFHVVIDLKSNDSSIKDFCCFE